MAKKSKKAGAFIPLVGAILVIIAIVLLAAPALDVYSKIGDTVETSGSPISGFEFFFNGIGGDMSAEVAGYFNPGPYTGLIVAAVLLIIGAVLPLVGIVLGKGGMKKGAGALEALGGVCGIVGGVMSLLALVIAGISDVVTVNLIITTLELGFQLQWGLWLVGILSIIGGIVSAVGGAKNALS